MMKYLLPLLSLLPALAMSVDPTTVCFAPKIEFNLYWSKYDISTFVAVDYANSRAVMKNSTSRNVIDLKNLKSYSIDAQGSCTSSPVRAIYPQCLPANSTLLTTTTLGAGNNALPIQVWDVPLPFGVSRMALQAVGNYFVPVILKDARVPDQLIIYTGTKLSISDASLFQIPTVCPAAPAV
ncbi:uncharacterized protein LOC101851553 [Aplysia californica]|uniref:Uncharacterized protein LOC101851553 n=1 Tax=Aplysia californica TaxID=6500 RepID=A0ABM1AE28_APLCA|nr:uncharacterized protein LOC101851553 [Aplysia californica]